MSSEAASHRPRAKNKRPNNVGGDKRNDTCEPRYPLAALLWPARAGVSQWVVLPGVLIVAGLFRWAVALWDYSGYQTPPMYGDFEAQRHWMELTNHLPISQWYFHDLEWWGLDYPPLTAYHSWLMGKIGSVIDPSWLALFSSRGNEDPGLKTFMRATVLASEFVIFVPTLIVVSRCIMRAHRADQWENWIALVALLLQPSTILIDHGHFQYNTVMLGFVLGSISSFYMERWLWCCIFFVAAIGYKQMALYYAPAVFASLLGICFYPRTNGPRLARIAVATLLSFGLLFAPLLVGAYLNGPVLDKQGEPLILPLSLAPPGSGVAHALSDPRTRYFPMVQQVAQSVHRMFPFARGIFEDKVANLWCVLNVVVKLRFYPVGLLQRASLVATLIAILPPCLILFLRPRSGALLYGFAATAWGFFLCSFQVHEKSVLLPLLPTSLLLAQKEGLRPPVRAWVGFANMLAVWTLFPLLKRDQLRVPYYVLTLLWAYLLGLPPTSLSLYPLKKQYNHPQLSFSAKVVHVLFYVSMVSWHLAEASLVPPPSKPDLWVVINASVGAAGFGLCYLWCLYSSFEGLIGPERWPPRSRVEPRKEAYARGSKAKGL